MNWQREVAATHLISRIISLLQDHALRFQSIGWNTITIDGKNNLPSVTTHSTSQLHFPNYPSLYPSSLYIKSRECLRPRLRSHRCFHRQGEESRQRQANHHHRQDHHRQGHPRGRGHQRRPRRGAYHFLGLPYPYLRNIIQLTMTFPKCCLQVTIYTSFYQ